jgi:hypothetical protein
MQIYHDFNPDVQLTHKIIGNQNVFIKMKEHQMLPSGIKLTMGPKLGMTTKNENNSPIH